MFKGPSSDDFDFDICCQDHDPEWSSKGLSVARYSLKSYNHKKL